MTAKSEFRWGESAPEGFVFSPDGRYLFGSAYYTGVSNIFRYEVASGQVEAVSNAETGFFRPVPLSDGRMVVLQLQRRGVPAGGHRPEAAEGRQLDPLPRDRSRRSAIRSSRRGRCRDRRRATSKEGIIAEGDYHPLASMRAAERVSGAAGLQGRGGGRVSVQLRRRPGLRRPRHHGGLHAERFDPEPARAATYGARPLPQLARRTLDQPLGLLRPVRSHQAQPQGLCGESRQ